MLTLIESLEIKEELLTSYDFNNAMKSKIEKWQIPFDSKEVLEILDKCIAESCHPNIIWGIQVILNDICDDNNITDYDQIRNG